MGDHKRDGRAKYLSDFSGVYDVHEFDIDVEKRDIFLFGREEVYMDDEQEPGVDYRMANRLIKNIRILQAISDEPILIHMKTNGGFWEEGMAIYNAIKSCPNYVVILNYTHARSMSSIILQAADYRAMMPDSTFMYHDGTFSFEGTVKQLHTEYAEVNKAGARMMDIYMNVTEDAPAWEGKNRKARYRSMKDQMNRKEEVYLDAQQAVDHGFADEIFGADGKYDWNALRNQ